VFRPGFCGAPDKDRTCDLRFRNSPKVAKALENKPFRNLEALEAASFLAEKESAVRNLSEHSAPLRDVAEGLEGLLAESRIFDCLDRFEADA
jgi:hypothetical protein